MKEKSSNLRVAIGQIAPVWLDRVQTTEKVVSYIEEAAAQGCELIAFGETLLPGYPFWLERTDGARFNSPTQKEIHAHYLQNGVQIEAGHLDAVCAVAKQHGIGVYVGVAERPLSRANHSIYCSLVYIDPNGMIQSVHRKLMPTYEERLTWSIGDGHGLRVHPLGAFTVGGLNCWENWMPLARAALYGQGENLHVAVWPGSERNTQNITRYIAEESRSFVISASSLMRKRDIPTSTPHYDKIVAELGDDDFFANGGSCIAAPDGSWVVPPQVGEEKLIVATLDHNIVLQERQNFDPSGHYARPDVTKLVVNRTRQQILEIGD